jgi:hypothetical protein
MNFERGIDPKRSMHIGIINWNNLSENCFLQTRKFVPFVEKGERFHYIFCCDGADFTENILEGAYLWIKEIKKEKNIIEIKYTVNWDREPEHHLAGFFYLKGSIERFRKYFNIIQKR